MDLAADKFDSNRFGMITGSLCYIMFPDRGTGEVGMTSYAKELATQRFFRHYDEVSTWQMQHGNMNEHEAFTYFQDNYNFTLEKGSFKMKGEHAGTSDAVADDYGVDFKCPTSLNGWLEYIYSGINKQQYNQCQMYMYLFDKPVWKIAAYLTETEWMMERELSYPVPMDKRMIVIDVEREEGWVDRLDAATDFVVEKRAEFLEVLKKQFS
jgi:hypothetical protein